MELVIAELQATVNQAVDALNALTLGYYNHLMTRDEIEQSKIHHQRFATEYSEAIRVLRKYAVMQVAVLELDELEFGWYPIR
jgi:hypothetical protein